MFALPDYSSARANGTDIICDGRTTFLPYGCAVGVAEDPAVQ